MSNIAGSVDQSAWTMAAIKPGRLTGSMPEFASVLTGPRYSMFRPREC
jgi:hypothetical protein